MPYVQKLLCKYCSHKFKVYHPGEKISIRDAYQVDCPNCGSEIVFVNGFMNPTDDIPEDATRASKIT